MVVERTTRRSEAMEETSSSSSSSCAGTRRSSHSHSSSAPCPLHSLGVLKTRASVLDKSPRFSDYKSTCSRDRVLCRGYSLNLKDSFSGPHFRATSETSQRANSKSIADLVGEIAALEQEVVRKELHLLSLYRAAFDQYLSASPTAASLVEEEAHQYCSLNRSEAAPHFRVIKQPSAFNLPANSDSKSELPRSISGHCRLANYLSASISDYVPEISCKLSEDIMRCISAVYCKLADPPSQDADSMASPTSPSVSSSGTFSPKHRNDSWSPRSRYDDVTRSPCQYGSPKELKKEEYRGGVVVVPRIHIDAEKFGYASKMLETIKSLIQRLEKIDPTRMEHEEQLCFWINIHNALVMHAFLAYGLHDKRIKNTDMILKAAYNVGGQSINAGVIQSSILGCQSHRPSLWVRGLFTPTKKSTAVAGSARHPYALHRPEPLAHFALSAGAFSDPPVRLYTARKIYHQLELARTEFVQANVNVVLRKQAIFLPKLLHYYAKDAALELWHIVEMVCESMSETQQKQIHQCLGRRRKIEKCIEWLPYKSSFRYILHRDLAEQQN